MNVPAWSLRIAVPVKRAQFRIPPVVIRMPSAPCAMARGSPASFATSLIVFPWRSRAIRTGEIPPGARPLWNLYRGVVPVSAVHPGSPAPAGMPSAACPAFCEKSSMVAPPGLKVAGSSGPPIEGKTKLGSRETKTSLALAPARRSMSFWPSIGRSTADAAPKPRQTMKAAVSHVARALIGVSLFAQA